MVTSILKLLKDLLFIIMIIFFTVYIVINVKGMGEKYYIPGIGNYKIMSVLSGSMRPVFNPGDVIIGKTVNSIEDIKTGDIITFRSNSSLVTHRIMRTTSKNGIACFQTKGDNNNVEDSQLVKMESVVSKYLFRIPLLGFLIVYLKGISGMIIFLILVLFLFFTQFISRNKRRRVSNRRLTTVYLNQLYRVDMSCVEDLEEVANRGARKVNVFTNLVAHSNLRLIVTKIN